MQERGQKIILSLYTEGENAKFWLNYEQLATFVPDISINGLRSQLSRLQAKNQVFSAIINDSACFRLSSEGRGLVRQLFPALVSGNEVELGLYHCIVFLEAKKTDKRFRYLRSFLLSNHFIAVQRGVYVIPGEISELVYTELQNRYKGSVLVFPINKTIFGDIERLIINNQHLADIVTAYSGISNQLNELLSNDQQISQLTEQRKIEFSSLFDRFYHLLSNEAGYWQLFFPQVGSALSILARFQNTHLSK